MGAGVSSAGGAGGGSTMKFTSACNTIFFVLSPTLSKVESKFISPESHRCAGRIAYSRRGRHLELLWPYFHWIRSASSLPAMEKKDLPSVQCTSCGDGRSVRGELFSLTVIYCAIDIILEPKTVDWD